MLKIQIVAVMRRSYPGISQDIAQWKGQDITDFQEDLIYRTRGQVSEKWFYTHFKSESKALPRIDVLNLLSRYAGYANWDDFRFKHAGKNHRAQVLRKNNILFLVIPASTLVILVLLLGIYNLTSTRSYTFCFFDADTKEPILGHPIEVAVLSDEESSISYLCDSSGCFSLQTDQSMIRMVVRSAYYRQDTIKRILKKFNPDEQIGLTANHYALMIRYFSSTMVNDWQRRREQLDRMFDDRAVIYQVRDERGREGIMVYNKQEFIDRLTMPTRSLQQMEVLNTTYFKERIMLLKFMIKQPGH